MQERKRHEHTKATALFWKRRDDYPDSLRAAKAEVAIGRNASFNHRTGMAARRCTGEDITEFLYA